MNVSQLQIKPFQINQITEFKIEKRVNEHVRARIKGYLDQVDAEDILTGRKMNRTICISYKKENGENVILFQGMILEGVLSTEGLLYEMEVIACSFTQLLDQEIYFRTFQNTNQSFKELAREIEHVYPNASVICTEGSENIENIQVQYQETDWEFLKRMASQINSVVLADCHLDKPAFYFGMREGNSDLEIEEAACIIRDCVTNKKRYREYEIETDICADIGDKVIYQNKKMQVYAWRIVLEKQVLKHVYCLRSSDKCKSEPYDNPNISGLSIKGKVVQVRNEKLRVVLEGDLGKETRRQWFDYATVYSSPDGGGWYFMPETGDEIRLYFPDEKAHHAYVLNSVHMENALERKNPDCKYIRTKYNKEIRFTPSQIKITNHKGSSIVLDDDKGITIRSNKSIVLNAGDNIGINGGKRVTVQGSRGVILRQNSNMIAVRDGIREHGARIERQ